MNPDTTRTAIGTGSILPEGAMLADRYRIRRLLGVGAMGMVYLARDEELDLDVALKTLRADAAARETRLERFRSELVLARQISHRNVVRIHDIGESDGTRFITMDYVEGESLKHVLERHGAMSPARAIAIAADLAEALAEAHRADIVHRDLKPANVLLGNDHAYLTDFGVARSLHSDGLTRTGEIVGTLDYLSPEQARGTVIDGRADIYSLGLLLYEMIVGTRPFTGETAEEVLAQRTLAHLPDMARDDRPIPRPIRRILERCLAVDPAARYRTADELASDLRSRRARRRWRAPRPRPALAAGLAAAAAIAGAVAWLAPAIPRGPAPADDESQVAVLPFELTVPSADMDGITHALSDLLRERLSAGSGLQLVASRRVYTTFADLRLTGAALPDTDRVLLGDLLDADYLIAGRLHAIGGRYRLEASLNDARSGEALHRAAVDIDGEEQIFEGIDEVAERLLASLALPATDARGALPSVNLAALNHYAVGAARLFEGSALEAITPLESAVREAPDFALAWDRLAEALAGIGRDREAMAAADSAVSALGEESSRTASLVRARKAAIGGELGRAAETLESLLQRQPGDTEVRFRLAEIYGNSGKLADAIDVLEPVVEESPNHPQAWYLLGKFSILSGDGRRAVDEYLVRALVIQNRLGNPQGRADVLNALGIAQAQLGNAERATDYYREALGLRREIGDERGVASVLANMARISLQARRYDEARQSLVDARDTLERIGDRWTVANLENELGFLEERRGRYEQALSHYREALRIRDELGDRRAIAESYNNVGYAYYLLGQYDNAAVFIDRSLQTYRGTDNSEGVMLANQAKGILNIARGEYTDALAALVRSLELSRDLDDRQAEAIAEGYIGRARHLQGRYAVAAASLGSAVDKLEAIGDTQGMAEFALREAQLALDLGMWAAAADGAERVKALLRDDPGSARRALRLRVEGEYFDAVGEAALADARFHEALREAEASGEQLAILHARLALAGRGDAAATGQADVAGLRSVYEAARQLGHGELEYRTAIRLGRACLEAERFGDAEEVLRSALPFRAGDSLHGEYRLHVLLADALTAQGRGDEALLEWEAARAGVTRALDAQTEEQRTAFRELPTVRRVLDDRTGIYAAGASSLAAPR